MRLDQHRQVQRDSKADRQRAKPEQRRVRAAPCGGSNRGEIGHRPAVRPRCAKIKARHPSRGRKSSGRKKAIEARGPFCLMSRVSSRWSFAIDRGGTFTDIVARDSAGRWRVEKLLSDNPDVYEDA